MHPGMILLILVLLIAVVLPTWPHSRQWGYFPSGSLGVMVVILSLLMLTGRL
jgi:hypothetical protein